jgi:hypothetical protein
MLSRYTRVLSHYIYVEVIEEKETPISVTHFMLASDEYEDALLTTFSMCANEGTCKFTSRGFGSSDAIKQGAHEGTVKDKAFSTAEHVKV